MLTPRHTSHGPTWHDKHQESLSLGQRLADSLAGAMGSWKFIITQTLIVILWMSLNVVAYLHHWDPFPFILLNLLFSTQAAYAAPIIMMSQNRQADRDRHQALADYETNVAAKLEIEELQQALARIENEKLNRILAILNERQN
ncbi:MAG: DUF1003 domain-containing protein [Candidatus Veblenbacteria bacterium]|nr:DUF1003 domain-containing protein [Candidatus Veblenbacteria bacterium]